MTVLLVTSFLRPATPSDDRDTRVPSLLREVGGTRLGPMNSSCRLFSHCTPMGYYELRTLLTLQAYAALGLHEFGFSQHLTNGLLAYSSVQ